MTATALCAQRVARAALSVLGADGVNVFNCSGVAAWQTVFHFHMHVIPRHRDSSRDRMTLFHQPGSPADAEAIAERATPRCPSLTARAPRVGAATGVGDGSSEARALSSRAPRRSPGREPRPRARPGRRSARSCCSCPHTRSPGHAVRRRPRRLRRATTDDHRAAVSRWQAIAGPGTGGTPDLAGPEGRCPFSTLRRRAAALPSSPWVHGCSEAVSDLLPLARSPWDVPTVVDVARLLGIPSRRMAERNRAVAGRARPDAGDRTDECCRARPASASEERKVGAAPRSSAL